MAVAETESCLIGINKAQLAIMQKNLLEGGNEKDYFVIESILKGNFLIKDQWRKEFHEDQFGKQLSHPSQRDELNERESLASKGNDISVANVQVNNQFRQY